MAHPPTDWVAANVRAELARARRSARRAALDLDWSPSTMSRRLSGEIPFTIAELLALSLYLDVPLTQLIDDRAGAA